MTLDALQYLLGAVSGGLVGFSLGLFGGGGSILAVPLMVYVVGVADAHIAIGTSAVSVASNAALGLISHARSGTVRWRCAAVYLSAGVFGALLGSSLGKIVDGQKLLLLFSLVMVVAGVLMFRRRGLIGDPAAQCTRTNAPKVLSYGGATGLLSGFFGIGGGFLVVPGLVLSTGMTTLNAIGSSLLVVTGFGLTTAVNYAASGLVDWTLALLFVVGGATGSLLGTRMAHALSARKGVLNTAFATLIICVALYMGWRNFN